MFGKKAGSAWQHKLQEIHTQGMRGPGDDCLLVKNIEAQISFEQVRYERASTSQAYLSGVQH